MAAKKKAKKQTARKATSRRGREARSKASVPGSLEEYVKEVQVLLDNLEREMAKAGTRTQRETGRLLRQASRQLGRIEKRGEAIWRSWTKRTREEGLRLIDSLRGAIVPAPTRKTRKRRA